MDLDELKATLKSNVVAEVIASMKRRQPPYDRPVEKKVILVTNEAGQAEYMWRYPDGHLEAI